MVCLVGSVYAIVDHNCKTEPKGPGLSPSLFHSLLQTKPSTLILTASAGRAPRTKNIQGGSEDSCSKPYQETRST